MYLVFVLFLALELLKPLQVPDGVIGESIFIQNKPYFKVRATKVTLRGLGLEVCQRNEP